MPAYNFQTRFAAQVLPGIKKQTIRRSAAKVGSTAYLFTGQRTRACERIGQGKITSSLPIEIGKNAYGEPYANIEGRKHAYLLHVGLDELAKADGFQTAAEMADWFESTYGLPFSGFLIEWEPTPASVAWCWASGMIEIGEAVPDGAIKIAEGPMVELKVAVGVAARHGQGRSAGKLLVPGIPEADPNDEAARGNALATWLDWCAKGNGKKHRKGVVFMGGVAP